MDAKRINPEQARLQAQREGKARWNLWGPYLAERQWGTVREDYSAGGNAWDYFPHDQARSRAYRWGEDGLLGICDEQGKLCFGLALWNGQDPILKERLFGLTNGDGNHGEDVKELYAGVRGRSLLRCDDRVRQADRHRPAHRDPHRQPRARGRDPTRATAVVVSQHMGVARRPAETAHLARRRRAARG
jgi:hypothetical protein